ncbi:MAG: hypothetical protein CML68_00805 [Rhodobacteraceae bacterium]|nr:hypothetical protein [Paracoccaceae bacterium]
MNKLTWDGRYKGSLVVMMGPDGKEAKSGSPINPLATLNKKGRTAADIIASLEDQRWVCQNSIKEIKDTSKRISGKCQVVAKALKAANDQQNALMAAYSAAVDKAKAARAKIPAAQSAIETAFQGLENAKKKLEKFEIDTLKDKTEKELQGLKSERDATIASIKEILSIAKLIRGGKLVDLADTAINKIATHTVKVDYQPRLKELEGKVAKLTAKSANLAKEIALGEVAEATKNLQTYIKAYNAQEVALNAALTAAAKARKLAIDKLHKRSSTSALGDIMDERRVHVKYVALTKKNIANYKAGLDVAMKLLSALERDYSSVRYFLKGAEKKDKSYGPETAYGKATVKAGLGNSVLLGKWSHYAKSELAYCKAEMKYLNDQSAQGPFAGFDKVQKMMEEAQITSREKLRAHGLNCD